MRLPALLLSLFSILWVSTPAEAQSRDPLPVPDVAGYKTLKCDFHMHTVFSDGEVWPTTRVVEAWRDGLDVISITDHAGYNPHSQDVPANLSRPYEIARGLAAQLGIVLIQGVEVMQGDTHLNALFVTDPNAFMGLKLEAASRLAGAQKAFVFWNHPGWKAKPSWIPEIAALHKEGLVHGVEIVNGTTYYPEAFPWIEEKALTIIANSDVHAAIPADYRPRTRPLTLVFASTADADGVREALFARRTAAWMGGEIWGSEQYLRELWAGAVKIQTPELRMRRGGPAAGLIVRNFSAIPFQARVIRAPEWLQVAGGEIRPESIMGFQLRLRKEAPAGVQAAELECEVKNLHTAPGRDLTVRLPVRIEVLD